ncbi:MAG: M28 family peptidase [Actinomycetota bacterium]|nr:M28 family peptidase [Actinomycetota bacterium]
MDDGLARAVEHSMQVLTEHPDRRVGGPGNLEATEFFAKEMERCGLEVSRTEFECVDWEYGEAWIECEGERFQVFAGPYSLPCEVDAELVSAVSVEDLESESVRGRVVLLRGDLARSQIMPRNFTFYNPESHKRVYRALDAFGPAAIIAATGADPEMVGAQYPFPLFEDGDLDIPNAYMKDVDGERLLAFASKEVSVRIDSGRVAATGEHVVATKAGDALGRVVLTAHIDSRTGSPGAIDNASGVAALLGLARLLGDYTTGPTVELVPFNGEDNYANPGEMLWVAENDGRWEEIVLGVNIDDAGQRGTGTHVSMYGVPEGIGQIVRSALDGRDGFAEGPQWFQSDHAILGLYGRPAIAIASSDIAGFMASYAHSDRDTLELADPAMIAGISRFLRDIVDGIAASLARS